jgi:hypothetical protein
MSAYDTALEVLNKDLQFSDTTRTLGKGINVSMDAAFLARCILLVGVMIVDEMGTHKKKNPYAPREAFCEVCAKSLGLFQNQILPPMYCAEHNPDA